MKIKRTSPGTAPASRRGGVIALAASLLTSTVMVTVSAPAEALTVTRMAYALPAAQAYVGAAVTVAGTASPASAVRPVYLQRYYSRAWHRVATTQTSRGAFKVALPTTTPGTFVYRLAVPAIAGGASATSQSITLAVIVRPQGGNPAAYRFLTSAWTPTVPVARWNPCRVIGYRVNLANTTPGALTDVKGAIARVSSATGLTFVYRGTTMILPGRGSDQYPADTDLVISWAKPGQSTKLPAPATGYRAPAGTGGASWGSAWSSTGKPASMISKGFVVLNATMTFAGGFGSGPSTGLQGTRGQLLMHELGHAMGLDHPIIKDRIQIMNPLMSAIPAVWGAGDANGLRLVGKSAGCMTTNLIVR